MLEARSRGREAFMAPTIRTFAVLAALVLTASVAHAETPART
jgi:hypothetical protein